MLPGARGGLSGVPAMPSPTTWWRTLGTLRGAPLFPATFQASAATPGPLPQALRPTRS